MGLVCLASFAWRKVFRAYWRSSLICVAMRHILTKITEQRKDLFCLSFEVTVHPFGGSQGRNLSSYIHGHGQRENKRMLDYSLPLLSFSRSTAAFSMSLRLWQEQALLRPATLCSQEPLHRARNLQLKKPDQPCPLSFLLGCTPVLAPVNSGSCHICSFLGLLTSSLGLLNTDFTLPMSLLVWWGYLFGDEGRVIRSGKSSLLGGLGDIRGLEFPGNARQSLGEKKRSWTSWLKFPGGTFPQEFFSSSSFLYRICQVYIHIYIKIYDEELTHFHRSWAICGILSASFRTRSSSWCSIKNPPS